MNNYDNYQVQEKLAKIIHNKFSERLKYTNNFSFLFSNEKSYTYTQKVSKITDIGELWFDLVDEFKRFTNETNQNTVAVKCLTFLENHLANSVTKKVYSTPMQIDLHDKAIKYTYLDIIASQYYINVKFRIIDGISATKIIKGAVFMYNLFF